MGGAAKAVVGALNPVLAVNAGAGAVANNNKSFLRKAGTVVNPTNALLADAARGKDPVTKKGGVIDTSTGNRARREASEQLADATKRQSDQAASLDAQRSEESRQAGLIAERNRQRSRFRALSRGGGRGGTILTSSLGLSGSADTAQKQLLGQ